MNDIINHPAHYTGVIAEIECIDIARHLNFQLGNAFKYVWRAGKKGAKDKEVEDLKKALWYLEDANLNNDDRCRVISDTACLITQIVTRDDQSMRAAILRDIVAWRIIPASNRLRDLIQELEASNG